MMALRLLALAVFMFAVVTAQDVNDAAPEEDVTPVAPLNQILCSTGVKGIPSSQAKDFGEKAAGKIKDSMGSDSDVDLISACGTFTSDNTSSTVCLDLTTSRQQVTLADEAGDWEFKFLITTSASAEDVANTTSSEMANIVQAVAEDAGLVVEFTGVTAVEITTRAPATSAPATSTPISNSPPTPRPASETPTPRDLNPTPAPTAVPIVFRSLRLGFKLSSSVVASLESLVRNVDALSTVLESILSPRSVTFVSVCIPTTCYYVLDGAAKRFVASLADEQEWVFVFDVESDLTDSDMREAIVMAQADVASAVSESATLSEVTAGTTSDDSDDDLSDGSIAGIVIGVVLGVAVAIGIAIIIITKSRPASQEPEQQNNEPAHI